MNDQDKPQNAPQRRTLAHRVQMLLAMQEEQKTETDHLREMVLKLQRVVAQLMNEVMDEEDVAAYEKSIDPDRTYSVVRDVRDEHYR